jgi:hypothetical protein
MFAPRTSGPGGYVKFEPGGAGLVPSVHCIFNDGRSAAWAGATLAGCLYGDPSLARAWACGWRAGQAEQRGHHA